ncbi:phosphatidylglycerol lysyltransferase domain-containing protein [Jhaorihella thermophila]
MTTRAPILRSAATRRCSSPMPRTRSSPMPPMASTASPMATPPAPTRRSARWLGPFRKNAHAHGATPIFHEVSDRHRALWTEMGLTLQKIGEEPVVRLRGLLFGDPRLADLLAALKRPEIASLTVEVLQPPHDPALLEELEMVSVAWQARGTGREKGFAVGRFDTDYLDRFPLAVARHDVRVTGFASVLTAAGGKRLSVDLVRFVPDEGRATMTALFAELIRHFRDRGAEELGLGLAPPSPGWTPTAARDSGAGSVRPSTARAARSRISKACAPSRRCSPPDWRPRYIAVPPTVPPLVALRNVAELIGGRPPRGPRQWRRQKTAATRDQGRRR